MYLDMQPGEVRRSSYGIIQGTECAGEVVPVLVPKPFQAAEYRRACELKDRRVKKRLAEPLIITVKEIGFATLNDSQDIVNPHLLASAYEFIDVLFSLDRDILRKYHGDQHDFGYVGPGEENYGRQPESWKESLYLSKVWEGGERKLPSGIIPSSKELRSLGTQRTIVRRFFSSVYPRLDQQFQELSTLTLNALGEYGLGLGANHFSTPDFQGSAEDKGFGVLRLIRYLQNHGAQKGDLLAGAHVDTSLSAIVDARRDQSKVGSLEAQLKDGNYAAVDLSGGKFSWNFGWMLWLYTLHRNGIDIDALNSMEDLEKVPPNIREKLPMPTVHRVVRREDSDSSEEVTERLAMAFFMGAHPQMMLGRQKFAHYYEKNFGNFINLKP